MGSLVKRTPLKRKTRLRSKTGLKAKSRLRKVSKKQRELNKLYKMSDGLLKAAKHVVCCKCKESGATDRHHPYGRGIYIAFWIPLCRACHDWIHKYPNKAMKLGWLQPEYRGQKGENHPTPWVE